MVVLLAENYDPLREMFAKAIYSWGHTVLLAKNGRQALLALNHSLPHVVITDFDMGDEYTGHDVARAAKKCDPSMRVMLMSGEEQTLGDADAFFLKPVSLAILQAFIEGPRLVLHPRP